MKTRVLALGLVWVMLIGVSCANEPFVLHPLVVTEFGNVTSGITSRYTYKSGKMRTFTKSTASQTIASMKFIYTGDQLDSIIRDSTAAGYLIVKVYGYRSSETIDSAFLVTADTTMLREVRKLENNSDNQPVRIEIAAWEGTTITQSVFELDWDGGNVSEIRTLSGAENPEVAHVVALTYDDQKGVFSSDVPFEYTLPPDELYWLSANNPVRFKRDTASEKKYSYSYNLKGYPSHIITDRRNLLACTYAELR